MRDQSGKALWAVRKGRAAAAQLVKSSQPKPFQEQPTTRVGDKQGLWSPILLLEKQDREDSEALPRLSAIPIYNSRLESAFRHRLPVLVFYKWKHKAAYWPFTEELDSMTLVGPFQLRIFCDSDFKFIVQKSFREQGLKRQQDRIQVVVWNARQWCWGWPCSRAVSLLSFPCQGSSDPCISLLLFACGWMILTFVSKCKYLPLQPNTLIIQRLGHSPSNSDKNQHIQGTRKKRQCKSESANVSNMLVRQAFLNAPRGCSHCRQSHSPKNLDDHPGVRAPTLLQGDL